MPDATDAAGAQPLPGPPRRLVIAITGATGAIYGIRLLQVLRATPGMETHLMLSEAGVLNLHQELDMNRKDAEAFAHVVHNVRDIGASIASGSFQSEGMIVAPAMPSSARAAMRISGLGANAARTEASPKHTLPIIRSFLRPIRSATLPMVTRKPAIMKP